MVGLLQQPMMEHLAELRTRIISSAIVLTLTTVAGFFLSPGVIAGCKRLSPQETPFIQLAPGEVLLLQCKLALVIGVTLAFPWILYHLLRFVFPGLTSRERKLCGAVIAGGTGLFLFGAVFSVFAVIPTTLAFFLGLGADVAQVSMSIASYVDFCLMVVLLTGLLFELPMVVVMAALLGLVSSSQLVAKWREITVGLFVVAAVVTPSQDPVTLLVVGAALWLLLWVSVIGIRLLGR